MKKYTQEDFDSIQRDADGFKHLPKGDWTAVDFRSEGRLAFEDDCELGDDCKLGNWCKLGDRCTLGSCCTLGDECPLESGCVHNATYFFVSNIGSENRTAYAYCDRDSGEIFIRAGCWFSGIDDFIQRVRDVHGGTQHETDYLAFAEFAKMRFAQYQKGG